MNIKVTVIMTVRREMDLEIPDGGTEHQSDASAMAQLAQDLSDSIKEDPLLFVDSKDATVDVKVES